MPRQALWVLSSVACALALVPAARAASGAALPGPIVFTQLPAAPRLTPRASGTLRAAYGEGARIVLRAADGKLRVLTQGFSSAADPDVSFDASRILFAGKRTPADNWNIYEMNADGSGARQITRGLGDCRDPIYQSALFYLNDERPSYQVTFVSAAAGELNEAAPVPATNLYSIRFDGTQLRRLTYAVSSSLDPFQMQDGRILFASWQRTPLDRIDLFGVHLDGTEFAAFSGHQGQRIKHMACTTTNRLVVFVEADKAPWDGAGTLASLSLRRNLHSYRRITTEADGLFHSPSPLPDGAVLVSRRPAAGTGTHGIYRLDPETGKAELVFDDPAYHDIQAKILAPRAEPDGHSSVVDETEPAAKLYCLDLYTSDLSPRLWPAGSVKRLRVLEGLPRRAPAGASQWLPRRFLGEIDVEEDGSFQIQVPANIPLQLQALDRDGMALRATPWIWAKNKENRGCIGCHEDGERTPENVFAKALAHPAIQLTLPPERRRTVEFRRDVAPLLARKCATQACHGGPAAPRLDRETLLARKYVQPGTARTSPLLWSIFGRNTSRPWDRAGAAAPLRRMPPAGSPPLTDDEKRTIIEWIDLGAQP